MKISPTFLALIPVVINMVVATPLDQDSNEIEKRNQIQDFMKRDEMTELPELTKRDIEAIDHLHRRGFWVLPLKSKRDSITNQGVAPPPANQTGAVVTPPNTGVGSQTGSGDEKSGQDKTA